MPPFLRPDQVNAWSVCNLWFSERLPLLSEWLQILTARIYLAITSIVDHDRRWKREAAEVDGSNLSDNHQYC
jgi:hypothetical protein